MRVTVIGAGVAGLCSAIELVERGIEVDVVDRTTGPGPDSCSWRAGGMLAPWCEGENAEAEVVRGGQIALNWWPRHIAGVQRNGTLVVAAPRDGGELDRFYRRTENRQWLDEPGVAALEPDLAGRFRKALYFPEEGHLDPRDALAQLRERLASRGVTVRYGVDGASPRASELTLDCRGLSARDALLDLRGVRGEMLILRTHEISLARPVRFLHPRIPLYVVPRGDGLFMVGATMIESADAGGASARSAIELLSAAFALHPAFGEAEIVEIGAGVRPAFPDNLPRIEQRGATTYLNGLYRHGFLLAPAYAARAAEHIALLMEDRHEADRQRRRA
jgi:glycine oxidase